MATEDRPNLRLVMSDQHDPRTIRDAGQPSLSTPSLDALAARGTVFTDVHCTSPIRWPS